MAHGVKYFLGCFFFFSFFFSPLYTRPIHRGGWHKQRASGFVVLQIMLMVGQVSSFWSTVLKIILIAGDSFFFFFCSYASQLLVVSVDFSIKKRHVLQMMGCIAWHVGLSK